MLAKSQRAQWSADCPAQEDSWGLVCGGSRFPAVAGDWEKSGEHSQIKHNSQEMSQNTCERSGFAKYKPRVQYFDLTTQKKMVIESEEKRFWVYRGASESGSVILMLISPRMLQKVFSELTGKRFGGPLA